MQPITDKDQCSLCHPIDGVSAEECDIPKDWRRRPLLTDGEHGCAYFNPEGEQDG